MSRGGLKEKGNAINYLPPPPPPLPLSWLILSKLSRLQAAFFSKQDSFIHDYKMRRIQLKSFTKNCATLLKSTIDLEWQKEWYISIFNQYVKTGTSWDLRTLNNALCHKGCHFWGGVFFTDKTSLKIFVFINASVFAFIAFVKNIPVWENKRF